MPELLLGVKTAEQSPNGNPACTENQNLDGRQIKQPLHGQGGQEPNPAQQIACQGMRLAQGLTLSVRDADVPGFHGQGLALGPEPGEVNAQYEKYEKLQWVAVVHGVPGLAQGSKQVASNEDHTKQQHAFVKPAGHAAAQSGRLQRGWGAGVHAAAEGAIGWHYRTPLEGWRRRANWCDNARLQLKTSKRINIRPGHELWAHGVGLKSQSHLTRVDAKGHPRFFVREIHKG